MYKNQALLVILRIIRFFINSYISRYDVMYFRTVLRLFSLDHKLARIRLVGRQPSCIRVTTDPTFRLAPVCKSIVIWNGINPTRMSIILNTLTVFRQDSLSFIDFHIKKSKNISFRTRNSKNPPHLYNQLLIETGVTPKLYFVKLLKK